ncbi:MAG: AraC family transcriptional regulator, partial [Brevundimonas sp.]
DLYEVSGVSEIDRLGFFNITRSTMSSAGVIGSGRSVRQTLERTPGIIRRSDVDGLNMVINRAAMVGDCDGQAVRAAPGALQFRDMGRPSASRMDAIDLLTCLIPRNLAPPALLKADRHGLVLEPSNPGVRLIRTHMSVLVEEAGQLTEAELAAALQALLFLASRVAGLDAELGGPELAALQSTVRRTAAAHIERHMKPGAAPMDVDALATAAGVSRATLYRAFDGDGGVNRYIQDRRLHHARLALRSRRAGRPTISSIADDFGFASASHFGRLFRARYGYSPSEVEAPGATGDLSLTDGPIRHDLLSDWLAELKLSR